MTAPTHVSFAGFVYLLLLTTTGVALSLPNALTIGFAALLPDIDTGASTIGRLAPAVSRAIERRFGHRTLTHSALCIAGLAVALLPLLALDSDLYACILTGYATHPFLDTMTVTGVKLFHPFSSVRCVFPLEVNHPSRYRTRTGSKLDRVLGMIFLLGCIPTFLVASQGYERFVRFAQRNVESAVRDYNEFSRSYLVVANISGHNLLTKEHVAGRFEIAGALNNHTLLFRGDDGRLHSLGNEYQAEYVAESALCERGDPVRVIIRRLDMENQPLAHIESIVDSTVESLFFGELSTPDHFTIPQDGPVFAPVTGSSGSLRLHYASVDDVRELQLENLFITRGTLTVRTFVRENRIQDSLITQLPGVSGALYSRVGFEADQKEPVEFMCGKGDTVGADQALARWGAALDAGSRIGFNNEKIAALEEELSVRLSDLQGRIRHAQDAVTEDSAALGGALDLARRGFVTGEVERKAGARYRTSRGDFLKSVRSVQLLRSRTGVGIRKLRLENELLTKRSNSARGRSQVRSPVRGVIAEIRQDVLNNRLRVSMLIKRF